MSVLLNDKTNNREILLAGTAPVDILLDPTSKNAIMNKTVYNALQEKVEKTVNDLINYYVKSDVYNKAEVRDLIGALNTLTIEVVNSLPASDISTTTIYFLKQSGSNAYDEYVYVNNAWVKIGDTDIDLSQYVTSSTLTTALQDYYTKNAVDTLFTSYYTKTEVDTELTDYYDKNDVNGLLANKQAKLTFDSAPTAGSSNPVTSAGIKTAIDSSKSGLQPVMTYQTNFPRIIKTNTGGFIALIATGFQQNSMQHLGYLVAHEDGTLYYEKIAGFDDSNVHIKVTDMGHNPGVNVKVEYEGTYPGGQGLNILFIGRTEGIQILPVT